MLILKNIKILGFILFNFLIFSIFCYLLFKEITILVFPDSTGYTTLVNKSITSREFFTFLFHGRPFTVPLFYWFLKTHENIVTFQKIFYFLSCTIFGLAISFTFHRNIFRILSPFLMFLCLFDREYLFWNHAILSESITLSLVLLFLTFIIWIYLYQSSKLIIWLMGFTITFLMVGARDSNAYIAFSLALIIPWLFFKKYGVRKGSIRSTIVVSILVCMGLFQYYNALVNGRYLFSLVNVINKRILPSKERKEYFLQNGFPNNEEVKKCEGKWASECNWSILEPWLRCKGQSVYMKFLLRNCAYTFGEIYKHINSLLNPELFKTHSGRINMIDNAFPKMGYLSFFKINFNLLLIDFLIMVFILISKKVYKVYLPIIMMFIGITQLFICFHGDAMEFERHCLIGSLIIKISFLLTIFIFLENIKIRCKNYPSTS